MRRLLRFLVVTIVLIVAGFLALAVSLRPPELAVPALGETTFENVTILNPGRGRETGMTVRIRGGVIQAIERASDQGTASPRYVMPGLVDMHVHTVGAIDRPNRLLFALLELTHGVTAVRDTGNFDDSILALRNDTGAGLFPGPRIFACGPLLDGEPSWWPRSRVVRSRDEARAAVDALAALGVDCVKAYALLSADSLDGIREAAAAHGLPVIGHVPVNLPFEQAHLNDVQHLTGVPSSPALRLRSGFSKWWGAGWRAVDDARMDFVVRVSVEQKIAHTPTIVVWQGLARAYAGGDGPWDERFDLLPAILPAVVWRLPERIVSTDDAAAYEAAIPKMKELVQRLHAAGVRLHIGTDVGNPFVIPGASVWDELRNFVDAGLTPEQALEAATRNAGESLGLAGLGTIAEGAPADLVVLAKDPTVDLANLASIETVVTQGRVYTRSELDAAIERHQAYFGRIVYRVTLEAFARAFRWMMDRELSKEVEIAS